MPQNAEAAAFLARVVGLPPGPGVSLDAVLQPSLDDEAQLRKMFAQDKANARLDNPHVGLVDIFEAPGDIRVTRARVVQDEHDLSAKYIMPLTDEQRRKDGAPCMVENLDEFKRNWAIFTEGSLSQLTNWNNVVAAGGAIQACLSPVHDDYKVSKRALRKHFHSHSYPTSDVDLFLYGLTPEQAEVKINEIYEAVRDSIPWDVTCIRTKHTISIHSQYPYRSVQIVLRLYQSPAEILAGFDVDVPCCAYDGHRVWANPRAIVAMMRQCNTVDVTRRSPSYEVRLSKYSSRGFEIYVPQLKREDIDPTIFERSIVRIQGLARLLVLEKLATAVARDQYLVARRALRGRPAKPYDWRRYAKRKYKGDLKQDADNGLELSDYDVVSLHIPYGPGWDARRIDKLVYQTDLGMNSPFNPKNKDRTLHRHAAFFGTMKECLEDCCEFCPVPETEEDKALQEDEDKSYIRGRVSFIEEDPGRQSLSGSFNPIDDGEWSEMAYMGVTEKFFAAIASHDRAVVKRMIEEGADVDRRDHVGRTPLQMAVLSSAEDIACDLVDANARMTARLADGRTALHVASQLGLSAVVRKLLERSALNAEAAEAAEENKQKEAETTDDMDTDDAHDEDDESEDSEMRDSSEDDWDSDEDQSRRKRKTTTEKPAEEESDMNIPEDEEDAPDVFDLQAADWDYGLSALDYAIIGGSVSAVELLLAAGADPKKANKANSGQSLSLTALTRSEEVAGKIIEKLLAAGAVSSEADQNLFTGFHRLLITAKSKLVATLLRTDPNAKAVLDVPWMDDHSAVFPIVSTILMSSYSMLAILLAYGAKLNITEDDFQRARDMRFPNNTSIINFRSAAIMPAEIALARQDDIVHLLVALGADFNQVTKNTWMYTAEQGRMSLLDFVRVMVTKTDEALSPKPQAQNINMGMSLVSTSLPGIIGASLKPEQIPVWQTELQKVLDRCNEIEDKRRPPTNNNQAPHAKIKSYFEDVESLLVSHGAKTASELAPFDGSESDRKQKILNSIYGPYISRPWHQSAMNACSFWRLSGSMVGENTTLTTLYKELFTACWNGDNVKIQRLCLPQNNGQDQKGPGPLQMAVRWGDNYRGFTPLHIAFMRRHWETARLVLAIAASQYDPDEPEGEPFQPKNFKLDDDSDDEEDSDDDDDMEDVVEEVIDFVDIAKRPTTVHSKARPQAMLGILGLYLSADSNDYKTHRLAVETIASDDFEAFTRLLDLYRFAQGDSTEGFDYDVLPALLFQYDRPAMLNEYIMRTGSGISLKSATDDQSEDVQDTTDQSSRVYLGLNVHGRKRKDLARKADPNARGQTNIREPIPPLWQAAKAGQIETLKYLASTQPAEAYRLYAASHSDERATLFKKIPDLATFVPARLGWTPNALNESVLLAAVIANRKDAIETLAMLRPNEIASLAHLQHKTLKFNLLLAAARWGCDPWVFDFLLGQKVSPMEVDHRGYNIFHILCFSTGENFFKLFKHALHQLPVEVIEFLLRQQSKEMRNTTSAAQYLQRDANGCIPLHLAVKFARPEITRLIATAGPVEALTIEDSVGTTPLETATRDTFVKKINSTQPHAHFSKMHNLPPSFDWNRKPLDVAEQEKELVRLRETIQDLLDQGRLINGTKLAKELIAYADHLEGKIATEKAAAEEAHKEEAGEWTPERDVEDTPTTLDVLVEALSSKAGMRRLVHLSDVHESVQTSFATSLEKEREMGVRRRVWRSRRGGNDDDDEEQQEEKPLETTLLTCDYSTIPFWNSDIWSKV
ncbi:hypothetical protein EIP86_001731 [Pleurotus ostreatoroseus]|nr:hypothetical protein EIP86_001731 [Pleurotus ostreatoroseus]